MKLINLFIILISFHLATSQEITVSGLTVEHKNNPIGLETDAPRLSWKIKTEQRDVIQTAYQIQVAEVKDFPTTNLSWESGKINSDQSILVPYAGSFLISGVRYYWRVKVWDNQGNESPWSQAAYWEMGLLETSDWEAKWIEPVQDEKPVGPAIYVRKAFPLDKTVVRARAYVTAHGLYELHINGNKIGDQVFTPGWTNYHERLQYQVYDITSMLALGDNVVGAIIGDGWYRGHLAWEDNWGNYGKKIGLLCQLVIDFADGSSQTIITDGSWKGTTNGPIVMNSLYDGEKYDATKELTGWDESGYNDKSWQTVAVVNDELNDLVPTQTVPIKTIQEITPVKIWRTPKGTLVADMGQNLVGWIKLRVKGKTGTTVTIRHAEVMDKFGEFYTENLRAAKATLTYTLNGSEQETYEPKFTFMGFRYIAIEGFPGELKPENLTGVVIHSDMTLIGDFECSNPLINQLQSNIRWGQKGNFLDVPTDCPQRDERLGWTGDAQAFVRTAAYNMDVAAFFTKWLKDVASDQDERGAVPFVVPNVLGEVKASAGWADVVTIAPWTIYQVYGDQQLLENQYASMRKYVEFLRRDAGSDFIWNNGSVFGDWLYYKPELTQHRVPDGHTDHDLIATAFFAYSTSIMIKAAETLGKTEDVKLYTEVFAQIKKAFNDNYITPAGRISSDSQTAYVLALMFNLLETDKAEKAINYLVEDIKSRDNHLSTGFLGTPYLCHVLSDHGKTNVAYDLLLQETFPSWLYPVKMGATTIWERWDGQKTDSTFQDRGMNSFNHYAYGAIGDWMYRVVAGLELGAPGYKKILIQPQPDSRLDYAKTSLDGNYGLIESGWKINNGNLTINVTIPPNTIAKVTLPDATINKVMESGKALKKQFKAAKEENGNVIVEIGSGKYSFQYNMLK